MNISVNLIQETLKSHNIISCVFSRGRHRFLSHWISHVTGLRPILRHIDTRWSGYFSCKQTRRHASISHNSVSILFPSDLSETEKQYVSQTFGPDQFYGLCILCFMYCHSSRFSVDKSGHGQGHSGVKLVKSHFQKFQNPFSTFLILFPLLLSSCSSPTPPPILFLFPRFLDPYPILLTHPISLSLSLSLSLSQ